MRRYFVLFSGRSATSEEIGEVGSGLTIVGGLRSAWARLLKSEQCGIRKAVISEAITGNPAGPIKKAIRFDLRGGNWVRVGVVEPNKAKKPEEVEKIS